MADGRHLENRYDVIILPRTVRFGRNLVGRCRMTLWWWCKHGRRLFLETVGYVVITQPWIEISRQILVGR